MRSAARPWRPRLAVVGDLVSPGADLRLSRIAEELSVAKVLYQGTTLVVPKSAKINPGFSP